MGRRITRDTKVPFGRPGNRGRPIGQQPVDFLRWISEKLWDTDKHDWAVAARKELERRKQEGEELRTEQELCRAADEFLRQHDIDPDSL